MVRITFLILLLVFSSSGVACFSDLFSIKWGVLVN